MVEVLSTKKLPHIGILFAAINQVQGSGSALRVLSGSGSAKTNADPRHWSLMARKMLCNSLALDARGKLLTIIKHNR
jgi:hypothetical protein